MFIGTIYPEGHGKNSTPFLTSGSLGIATFVVENKSVIGFGISDMSGVERVGPREETPVFGLSSRHSSGSTSDSDL
jgi:hypothetical protein